MPNQQIAFTDSEQTGLQAALYYKTSNDCSYMEAARLFRGYFLPNRSPYSVASAVKRLHHRTFIDSLTADRMEYKEAAKPIVNKVPSANRSYEEILADQVKEYERKKAHHSAKRNGIEITMPDAKPYAILVVGDLHAGDPGCDFEHFAYDLSIANSTEGCYALFMGDASNNWIGRLKSLYGAQNATEDEERLLVKHMIEDNDWLVFILGNHDKWGPIAELYCEQYGVPHVSHGAIFKVVAGDDTTIIDAAHTHPGSSQYNPAFAQAKRGYRGSPADVIIGAHTHTSGYQVTKNEVTGKINHAIRCASYKKWDSYPEILGVGGGDISPSVLVVVDPESEESGKISVFHDIGKGVKFLKILRDG